ncbi:MAG: methyltransferase [Helicobacteraceae bacterium]|jgi:16S rRNA (guanine1207-N2)-methyltransferase|nr:methyltransferase [Helicobacteraceae bacterium]
MREAYIDSVEALIHSVKQLGCGFGEGARIAVINAAAHSFFKTFNAVMIHSFFPRYTDLKKSGFNAAASIEGQGEFDGGVIFAGKDQKRNLYDLFLLISSVKDRGEIALVSPNGLGGKTFMKNARPVLGGAEEFFKKKHRVLIAKNDKGFLADDLCDQYRSFGDLKELEDSLFTRAGIFSSKKIDDGSKLLIETMRHEPCRGAAADFGSGNGYLSFELLKRFGDIESISLFEADYNALAVSKINIKDNRANFIWSDITTLERDEKFDIIVSNPPFHSGAQTDISLGKQFIHSAYNSLKRNGVFYVVANVKLPYEKIVQSLFDRWIAMAEKDGYKVLKATRS